MNGYPMFEIAYPGTEPVAITADRDQIRLGGEGRGRKLVIIPIASVRNFGRPRRTESGVAIVRCPDPVSPPAPALVAIDATGSYQKSRNYTLPGSLGEALIKGYTASGAAGRAGRGEAGLFVVQPGTEFCLRGKYAETWDGSTWRVESPAVRDARLALEEVLAGGGEWL